MISNSQTLCTQLWNHAIVDLAKKKIRACCKTPSIQLSTEIINSYGTNVFLNLQDLKNDRELMLNGGKPERCSTCWVLEEQGNFSFRSTPDKWHQYFDQLGYTDYRVSNHPNNLDIQLDNYCDLKCIYCNEEFSSQWQSEKEKFGELKNYIPIHKDSPEFTELFFKWFDSIKVSLERIAFLGGEPLISPRFYEYLDRILSSYHDEFPDKLEINIITNLNTKENYFNRFIKMIETYKNKIKFNINISMESYGTHAELIRHGLNFDRFKNNLEKLASIEGIILTNITSINLLCFPTLHKHLKLIIDLEEKYGIHFDIHGNLVTWPNHLQINLMDKDLGECYIQQAIAILKNKNHDDYIKFLNTMIEKFNFNQLKGSSSHTKLILELDKLGARRNVNYKEIFNEYKYIWE
jgi:sulfatase maturation enzyme AslB (radical SAM superfamily)